MSVFSRLNRRWPAALGAGRFRVDRGLAEAEGLAAGTGMLTGDVLRSVARDAPCPSCGGTGEAIVVDLVGKRVGRRCRRCSHRWDATEPSDSRSTS